MKLIKLTRGKFAQIDDEDFEELNKYKWRTHKNGNGFYAIRRPSVNGKQIMVWMHRVILNPEPGMVTDHIDGDGLNNKRSNLRIATRQENCRNRINANHNNRLGIKGVSWCKEKKKFASHIQIGKKQIHLGRFFCLEKAKKAHREAELKYFREFARKEAG